MYKIYFTENRQYMYIIENGCMHRYKNKNKNKNTTCLARAHSCVTCHDTVSAQCKTNLLRIYFQVHPLYVFILSMVPCMFYGTNRPTQTS